MVQALEWDTQHSSQLHLLLTDKEELSGVVDINGSLGCGDLVLIEFLIQRGERKSCSSTNHAPSESRFSLI